MRRRDNSIPNILAAWDSFSARVRERLEAGHEQYGEAWQKRGAEGNLREAQAEALDLAAYGFFAWLLAAGKPHTLTEGREPHTQEGDNGAMHGPQQKR